jgi:hypothetical protein
MRTKIRAWLLLVLFVAVATPATAASSPPPAPKLPANAFGSLRFNGRQGAMSNKCMGFVARCGGHRVLLSVLQVFGPEGGLPEQVPAQVIPDMVTRVDMMTPERRPILGVGTRGLLRSGRPFPDSRGDDATGDLIAFDVPANAGVGAFKLAGSNPVKGDWVFILSSRRRSNNGKAQLLPHRLAYSSPRCSGAKVDTGYSTTNLSGCPVLNRKGEVVGMYVGHAHMPTAKYLVFNPVVAIRQRVQRAYASTRAR